MFYKLDRNLWGVLVATLLLAPPAAHALTDDVAVQLLDRLNELEGELNNLRGENEVLRDKLQGVSTRQEELDKLKKEAEQAADAQMPDPAAGVLDTNPPAQTTPTTGTGFREVIEPLPADTDPLADIPPLESLDAPELDKTLELTPPLELDKPATDAALEADKPAASNPDKAITLVDEKPLEDLPMVEADPEPASASPVAVPPTISDSAPPPTAASTSNSAAPAVEPKPEGSTPEKVDPKSTDSYYYYGTADADKKEAPAQASGAAGASNKPSTDDKPAAATAEPASEHKAKAEYNQAYKLLVNDPVAATPVFRAFLQTYPNHELAANAQYWLGEALYAQRDYEGASREFMVVLRQFKESPKAPGAALKLGYSFYELKQWDFARRTLEDTVKFFPDSNAAKLAEERLKLLKTEGH